MEFNNIKNAIYPSYISEKRRPVTTPRNAVEDGIANFGTFLSPFSNVNLIDCKNPLGRGFPKFLLPERLKEWEAFEVNFDQGFLVGAIYDMGPAVFNILVFHSKITGRLYKQQSFSYPRKLLKNTLIDSVNTLKAGKFFMEINNQFGQGECYINASYTPSASEKSMLVNLKLSSISMPSIVNMPLDDNRPLYSHKELFKAVGEIRICDEIIKSNERTLAIIDDHKGFYPYNMHYDWLTGFLKVGIDTLSFNLTRNQVINPDDYNENYLWLNGEIHPLPVISFQHLENGDWHITDKFDSVNILFSPENTLKIRIPGILIKAAYYEPFGKISGYLRDLNGIAHSFDGAFGMGEDKSYRI